MHHILKILRQHLSLEYITLAYQILEPSSGSIYKLSTHLAFIQIECKMKLIAANLCQSKKCIWCPKANAPTGGRLPPLLSYAMSTSNNLLVFKLSAFSNKYSNGPSVMGPYVALGPRNRHLLDTPLIGPAYSNYMLGALQDRLKFVFLRFDCTVLIIAFSLWKS